MIELKYEQKSAVSVNFPGGINMKDKKIISSVLSALLLCSSVIPSFSDAAAVTPVNGLMESSRQAGSEEKKLIYRCSFNGESESSAKWQFTYSLTAYDNGQIHIDVQCEASNANYCNRIGDIVYDDSMIAAIGEKGAAGVSSFDAHGYPDSKYNTSFSSEDIIYTSIYSNWNSKLSGETLMSYDLYVKEGCLKTDQKLSLFGNDIEIPFGGQPYDKDARIAELESRVSELEAALDNVQTAVSALDVNGDGFIDSVDASVILWIYAYNSTSGTPILTMEEYYKLNKE